MFSIRSRVGLGLAGLVAALSHESAALAQANSCATILSGLQDVSITYLDEAYVSNVIRWLSQNEYSSETSARSAGLKLGMTIPIEGVPVNFKTDYDQKKYGSKSWSKAFAEFLQVNVEARRTFFQNLRTANPQVVSAWRDCVRDTFSAPGLHCWIVTEENPRQVSLIVKFVPAKGQVNREKISRVVLSDNIVSTSSIQGSYAFLQESRFNLVRRDFKDSSARDAGTVELGAGNERCIARLSPIEVDVQPSACTVRNKDGECVRCEFNLAEKTVLDGEHFDNVQRGSSKAYLCKGMPSNRVVAASLIASLNLLGAGNFSYNIRVDLKSCALPEGGIPVRRGTRGQQDFTFSETKLGRSDATGNCNVQLVYEEYTADEVNSARNLTATGKSRIVVEAR